MGNSIWDESNVSGLLAYLYSFLPSPLPSPFPSSSCHFFCVSCTNNLCKMNPFPDQFSLRHTAWWWDVHRSWYWSEYCGPFTEFIPRQWLLPSVTYVLFRGSFARNDTAARKENISMTFRASYLAGERVLSGPYYWNSLSSGFWQPDKSKLNLEKTNWAIAVELPAWTTILLVINLKKS